MPGVNVRNGNDGDTLSIIKEENIAATNHLTIKKQAWIFTKKEVRVLFIYLPVR